MENGVCFLSTDILTSSGRFSLPIDEVSIGWALGLSMSSSFFGVVVYWLEFGY